MQTVCAHCFAPLTHKQQVTQCILCTRCEHDWARGHRRARSENAWKPLPAWTPVNRPMSLDDVR